MRLPFIGGNTALSSKGTFEGMGQFSSLFLCLGIAAVLSFSCGNRESSPSSPPSSSTSAETATMDFPLDVHRRFPKGFDSAITSVFQDSKGAYWFGSQKSGVARFDGQGFRVFSVEDGLAGTQVRTIQEDREGTLWFGTSNGISRYDGKTLKTLVPDMQSQENWSMAAGDLWFAAGNQAGVYRYRGEQLQYLAFPETNKWNEDKVFHTTGIALGKEGGLWFATYSGVFGYDGTTVTLFDDAQVERTEGTGPLHIRSVFEDSRGRLWIGNNGLGVLLIDGGATIDFSKKLGLVPPLSGRNGDLSPRGSLEHVFTIEEDRLGHIWFGDRDTGAWEYDGKTMKNYSVDEGLPSSMVHDIYRDKRGELLFALANGSVYQFNGKGFVSFVKKND